MKARFSMLALSIALGVALAQTTPSNPTPQDNPQSTSPTTTSPQSDAKTDTTSGSAKMDKTTRSASTPSEMQTTTFKGVLVDLACSSGKSSSAENTSAQTSAASKPAGSEQANTADRSASDSGSGCPVSANSTQLGMKLDDGKTVRFDLVGNQRAQDALKNEKRMSKDMSANKPIRVKVSGVLNGDKLIVSSIH